MPLSIHMKVLPRAEREGRRKTLNVLTATRRGITKRTVGQREEERRERKGKAKAKPKEAAAVVAAKEKVEEKVEAWMVSLAEIDKSEESFDEVDLSCGFNSSDDLFDDMDSLLNLQSISNDSEIDEKDAPEHPFNLDESFSEEYTIPDTYPDTLSNPDTCSKVFDGLDSSSC